MINARKRTVATITFMSIFAVVILVVYFYWSNRTQPLHSQPKLTEVQKLAEKDLVNYYPGTSREVAKLFAEMMKALYNNPDDENIKALALKIRSLYDQEFLANNSENTYLNRLTTDLIKWKKNHRKITNYLLVETEQNQEREINSIQYSTQNITFTIQEHSKYTQLWKLILRQDVNNHWKILGWKLVQN